MAETWTPDQAQDFLGEVFAPWIQALGLRCTGVGADSANFVLPANPELSRGGGEGGGVVCGQAVAAAADTCSVVALAANKGAFRPCTTVDLTTHFMRPLPEGDVEITIFTLSNGRRMATTRAEFRAPGGKLAATATCAFAFLDV
ncbi:MAG: PaaI family thioesterase [Pseudomonadota bacterium]